MKLNDKGYPLVLLSHRGQEFLETTIESIHQNMTGVSELVVVDDSGDEEHYDWLDSHFNKSYSIVKYGENAGYLEAMKRVFSIAGELADDAKTDYVMLWEEDFVPVRAISLNRMAHVMDEFPGLAQLNLQRQPVYKVERRFGYMESHVRRGYELSEDWAGASTDERIPFVARMRPFTTNPGLIRREVLDIEWPSREECDAVSGGAEPAMSLVLENSEWYFGWYGKWNTPYTRHVGTTMKTGKGY